MNHVENGQFQGVIFAPYMFEAEHRLRRDAVSFFGLEQFIAETVLAGDTQHPCFAGVGYRDRGDQ
jgi:hypothetical protein